MIGKRGEQVYSVWILVVLLVAIVWYTPTFLRPCAVRWVYDENRRTSVQGRYGITKVAPVVIYYRRANEEIPAIIKYEGVQYLGDLKSEGFSFLPRRGLVIGKHVAIQPTEDVPSSTSEGEYVVLGRQEGKYYFKVKTIVPRTRRVHRISWYLADAYSVQFLYTKYVSRTDVEETIEKWSVGLYVVYIGFILLLYRVRRYFSRR